MFKSHFTFLNYIYGLFTPRMMSITVMITIKYRSKQHNRVKIVVTMAKRKKVDGFTFLLKNINK